MFVYEVDIVSAWDRVYFSFFVFMNSPFKSIVYNNTLYLRFSIDSSFSTYYLGFLHLCPFPTTITGKGKITASRKHFAIKQITLLI